MYSFGSTTFLRKDLERGLEPDECFYLSSAEKIHDQKSIDLQFDPPPDLAIEIDVTSHSGRRMSIYAALGVPEVWRFDGEAVTVLCLQGDGSYSVTEQSAVFPFLPMDAVATFIGDYKIGTDTRWARALRQWVRETVVPRAKGEGNVK
jgi:Uma2 family endonuclease